MIRVQINEVLRGLDGQPIVEGQDMMIQSKAVAKLLSQSQGDPLKLYDLSLRFWRGEPVELDESDFKLVRETVEKAPVWPLIKAPILRALDQAREESKLIVKSA